MFRIIHELDALTRDLGKIAGCVKRKALPMAANRVTASVKAVAIKELKEITGLKATIIRKDLRVLKFTSRSGVAHIDAVSGRARNLIIGVSPGAQQLGLPGKPQFFRRRAKTKGRRFLRTGVKSKAWGKARIYEGAFIAQGRRGRDGGAGNTVVYARRGRSRTSKLKGLQGPSVRVEFRKPRMQSVMRRKADERIRIELNSAIRQAVKRCGVRQ